MGYLAKGEDIGTESLDIIYDNNNFLAVFRNDITLSQKEILIVSPFLRKIRTMHMLQHLKTALDNDIRVIVVTRLIDDYKEDEKPAIQMIFDLLQTAHVCVVPKSNIHQKFAIMDQKIVWYGSINLLSYGRAQESIMRIESSNIANELVNSIEFS